MKNNEIGNNNSLQPVLLMISCKNDSNYKGFALDNETYSAYPAEREILLSEGLRVLILDVQDNFQIDNPNFGQFKIYIRYLTVFS